MIDRLLQRGADRYSKNLGPRAQVALCQLPLTVIAGAIALATPFGWPALLHSPAYMAGILLQAFLFPACLLIPWERLRPNAYLIIPVLDLVAIGFSRHGSVDVLPGLAVLVIFPIIWLAASGMTALASTLLSVLGPLLMMLSSLPADVSTITAPKLAPVVFLPLMTLTVSLSIRFARANMRAQERQLRQIDSELRRSLATTRDRERLLTAVLDATDVGVVAVDPRGQHLLMNNRQRAFEQIATPAGMEPSLQENEQLIFAQDKITPLPEEKRPVRRAIEGESFADYLVWVGEGPDSRALSTAARPMKNDSGELAGAVIVYSDVTSLVEAVAANEALVSNVSHEFRTPLNSIIGNIDLALEDLDGVSPRSVQRLQIVQRNSERLVALVSDLTLSATTAMNVHPKQTDLASLVETSISSAQAHADKSRVALLAEVPSPLWVYADPLRIGQVIDNLLSNAIKYSPHGGVVNLSAETSADWIQLAVRDTGMGMTAEDTARIFRRFFRTEAAREAQIPGAGLGLQITQAIVERHGGSIRCSSEPGCGSTFTIVLPTRPGLS